MMSKRLLISGLIIFVVILLVGYILIITPPVSMDKILTSNISRAYDYPILNHGSDGSWDDLNIGCPQIIDIDGQRRMYYLGQKSGSARLGVGFAYLPKDSNSGVEGWIKYSKNPILASSYNGWESSRTGILFGSIIKIDSTYFLYYSTFPDKGNNARGQIGVTTSKDGISWAKYKNNPILRASIEDSEYHLAYPYVIESGGNYYMYYTVASADTWWQPTQYRVAASKNGIDWERKGIVLGSGVDKELDVWIEGCSVYKANDGYILAYTGAKDSESWCITLASNKNPTGMFAKLGYPILSKSSLKGTFDSSIVATPYIFSQGNQHYLFYQGGSEGKLGYTYLSIGLARMDLKK
jgi:predicted GH43/DUF377 family glycosyl hydrolase